MGRVIVYIAASLDGFIASPDDDIAWLDPFTVPGEDYGYGAFMEQIGTSIMGARTWEQSLAHPERLLRGLKNYVLTSRELPAAPGADRELWHGTPGDLIRKIRGESEKDVYIVGGGQLISRFLDEGLIDQLCLFVVPVVLGAGIPLWTGLRHPHTLKLVDTRSYASGIVRLQYLRPAEGDREPVPGESHTG